MKPAVAHAPALDEAALVKRYCATCHSDKGKAGGLSLASFDPSAVGDHAETAEKMIRKLRAGMMPPPLAPRPEPAVLEQFVTSLERKADVAAKSHPNPGARPFQRLNRPEYTRAIKDLLLLDVDAGDWLPLDTMSAGFDNIADEQSLSPMLLEAYLNAAAAISRMAVGDRNAPNLDATYVSSTYVSQHPWDHVEGAPYGTRGGIVVNHVFPADAEYVFDLLVAGGENSRFQDIDISVDGERVELVEYENGPSSAADGSGGTTMRTKPILIRAGQHSVAAAFVRKLDGPYEDLIRPHEWSFAGGGSGGGGITTLPHLRNLVVKGPYRATGISDNPTRDRIFTCRPTSAANARTCARSIVTDLASAAYRRPVDATEVDRLMPFYDKGAAQGGFEQGVRASLEAVLSSPYFIFRLEKQPAGVKPGETYAVGDLALASRLSFFLWGQPPDEALIEAAEQGKLSTAAGVARIARRMIADPRAEALGTRFAAQWLRLQDIDKVKPDPNFFPNFDDNLAEAMRTETIMFFNSLVREDRSMLDLFNADYTFLNERLARHYGFPGVAGPEFRRVAYPNDHRRGLLGQGSVLVLTSMANRTSPVLRGKWVMEVLLGSPPPPPPPNVPALEESGEAKEGRLLTTREKMELHRANPTCNSCHRMMDPIGLSLDNFDPTAKWRERENGMPLDTAGELYDGTKITSANELTDALLKRPVPLVRTFTENLLAYALGRRVEYYDQPTIRAIAADAKAHDYKMSSFLIGVVTSDAFRMSEAPIAPETTTTETSAQQQ